MGNDFLKRAYSKLSLRLLSRYAGWADMFAFHRMVAGTLITHGALMVFSMVASVLSTRALGADGKGILSWMVAYSSFSVIIVVLGIGAASKKYIAKIPGQAPAFIVIDLMVLGCNLLLFMPLLYFYGTSFPVAQNNYPLFLLGVLLIPCMALSTLADAILIGLDKALHYNIVCVIEKISYTGLGLMLIGLGWVSPMTMFIIFAIGILCHLTVSIAYIKRSIHYFPSRMQIWAAFRLIRKLIFSNSLSVLAWYYTGALLMIVLGAAVDTKELGYYATAQVPLGFALLLPSTVGLYTLPRLAKETTHQGYVRTIRHILTLTLAGTSIMAIPLFFFSDTIVSIVFGHNFLPAGNCLKIMSFGMVAYGVTFVAKNIITLHHREWLVMVVSGAVAFCITVLTIALRDQLNAVTASYIYSITYGVGMVVSLGIVLRLQWVTAYKA